MAHGIEHVDGLPDIRDGRDEAIFISLDIEDRHHHAWAKFYAISGWKNFANVVNARPRGALDRQTPSRDPLRRVGMLPREPIEHRRIQQLHDYIMSYAGRMGSPYPIKSDSTSRGACPYGGD